MTAPPESRGGPRRPEVDDEHALVDLFAAIELPSHRVAQIEEVILKSLDRPEPRSLAAEWLELFKVRPLSTAALALAGAAGLVILSPASGLLFGLFGQ